MVSITNATSGVSDDEGGERKKAEEEKEEEEEEDDYPLNCYSHVGDGFSGWYAISDPHQCNDFCYWDLQVMYDDDDDDDDHHNIDHAKNKQQEQQQQQQQQHSSSSVLFDFGFYNGNNTADPHEITSIVSSSSSSPQLLSFLLEERETANRNKGTTSNYSTNTSRSRNNYRKNERKYNNIRSIWRCILNAAEDDVTWKVVVDSSSSMSSTTSGGETSSIMFRDFGGHTTTTTTTTTNGRSTFHEEDFSFLRCNTGPKQKIRSTPNQLVSSHHFWASVLSGSISVLVLEFFVYWYCWKRKRIQHPQQQQQQEQSRLSLASSIEIYYRLLSSSSSSSSTRNHNSDIHDNGDVENNNNNNNENTNENENESKTNNDDNHNSNDNSPRQIRRDDITIAGEGGDDNSNENSDIDNEYIDNDRDATNNTDTVTNITSARTTTNATTTRYRGYNLLTVISSCVIFTFNAGLLYLGAFTSILSMVEIGNKIVYPHALQVLTPACMDPSSVCDAGNNDIDRSNSTSTTNNNTASSKGGGGEPISSFSYLIASDAQLNWYDGEANTIGKLNYPVPCSKSDSCKQCTSKFGAYTNQQMIKAIEYHLLMTTTTTTNTTNNSSSNSIRSNEDDFYYYVTKNNKTKTASSNSTMTKRPVPDTLVMNGDLTAYFHRREMLQYESIYHAAATTKNEDNGNDKNINGPPKIRGLRSYFPSLGNHDYDHASGATFDDDEWFSPHTCNAKHSIAYIKSGFCPAQQGVKSDTNSNSNNHHFNNDYGYGIPRFDPNRIVGYDAGSLAYSWDEGDYHFVHLHYYPSYENAAIGLSSSIEWLQRDFRHTTASTTESSSSSKGKYIIVFVHSAGHLRYNYVVEDLFVKYDVKAIFAGHYHRCLGRKCVDMQPLYESEIIAELSSNNTTITGTNNSNSYLYQEEGAEEGKRSGGVNNTINTTDTAVMESIMDAVVAEKCVPGSMALCGGNTKIGGMSFFYVKDKDKSLVLPDVKLFNPSPQKTEKNDGRSPKCPSSDTEKIYINTTDNTLLCRKVIVVPSTFPFYAATVPAAENKDVDSDTISTDAINSTITISNTSSPYTINGNAREEISTVSTKEQKETKKKEIPIFWSGSASFETFLRADFYDDRFVVNVITAEAGHEGKRYIDVHSVPNAVYPHHTKKDLDETIIFI